MMTEMSLVERHVHEAEEHVARVAARIEEFTGLGMTQAADGQRVMLLALRRVLATDREHLRRTESK